jgi:hypothetical protein
MSVIGMGKGGKRGRGGNLIKKKIKKSNERTEKKKEKKITT